MAEDAHLADGSCAYPSNAARDVLWMATRSGARTLGLEHDIGSIEVGNYATRGSDVRTTIVDGEVLVDNGDSVRASRADVLYEATAAEKNLVTRAGV